MGKETLWPGWETIRVIGHGGFGAVYEIQRDLMGDVEKAALKVLTIPKEKSTIDELRDEGHDDASITQRFGDYLQNIVGEYKLMARMKGHPNVVYCDDIRYVQHDDGFGWDIYIKMELLTPMMKIPQEHFDEQEVIRLGIDICNALVMCKTLNIVHRDIKPQNIFISKGNTYKLGDFGISKTMEHTTGATLAGSFPFMAPEVNRMDDYGSSVDIYSLGLVLYWLLNKRRGPFLPLPPKITRNSEEIQAIKRRFNGEQIPVPATGSKELHRIVLKACSYNPKDRYSNAAEMKQALEQLLHTHQDTTEKPESKTSPKKEAKQEHTPIPEDDSEATVLIKRDEPPTVIKPSKQIKTPTQNKNKTNKKTWLWPLGIVIILVFAGLFAFGNNLGFVLPNVHTHQWQAATCSTPEKCSLCNETQGDSLEHKWIAATCTTPETCSLCGTVRGNTRPHTFTDADYEIPSYCIKCGYFQGSVLGKKLAANRNNIAYVKPDGTVVTSNRSIDTSGLSDIKSIASSGWGFVVGLRNDGTVVAAHSNTSEYTEHGQCDVSQWRDIVAIAVGCEYTVGLKHDGTVVATGSDYFGECDVSKWTDIVAISAIANHTVGLRSDGTVVATGNNNFGQCDVSEWSDIISVAAGEQHTVGLKRDGTVITAGAADSGQRDTDDWEDIIAISAGFSTTVGLKQDGTVVATGSNSWEEMSRVSSWDDIQAISAGYGIIAAMQSDGTVVRSGEYEGNWKAIASGKALPKTRTIAGPLRISQSYRIYEAVQFDAKNGKIGYATPVMLKEHYKDCISLTVNLDVIDILSDEVYGDWGLWLCEENGDWFQAGIIEYTGNTSSATFYFDKPVSFDMAALPCYSWAKWGFDHNFWLSNVKVLDK